MADPYPQRWLSEREDAPISGVRLRRKSQVHAIFIEDSALDDRHAAALAAQVNGPTVIVHDVSTSMGQGELSYSWFCIYVRRNDRPREWNIAYLDSNDPDAVDKYNAIKDFWGDLMERHRGGDYSYNPTQEITRSITGISIVSSVLSHSVFSLYSRHQDWRRMSSRLLDVAEAVEFEQG